MEPTGESISSCRAGGISQRCGSEGKGCGSEQGAQCIDPGEYSGIESVIEGQVRGRQSEAQILRAILLRRSSVCLIPDLCRLTSSRGSELRTAIAAGPLVRRAPTP